MKVTELVKAASAANARAFEKCDERTANVIANAIIEEIGAQIDAVADGRLTITGLGSFVVKEIDATAPATGKVKRIVLRRPASK